MAKGKTDVDQVADLLALTKVEKQTIVTFKGCGLKLDKTEDANDIVKAIEECPDLQTLELVGNTVGVDAAKLIANALKSKPKLERCLWADMFTGRLRAEIPISLKSLGAAIMEANAHLVELDLSDNAFGPDGAKACVNLLKSSSCYTLQELKFNNNGLGGGGIIIADTLIECHRCSSAAGKPLALKVFIAGRNRLENPGAKALAEAFKTIGTLEEIQLPQNGIQHEGIAALATAVKNNPRLRHLNLNDNTFTDKGAVAMGEALSTIDSLETINFGDCLVRTHGATIIAKNLSTSNPNLKQLLLSFGEIQLEGGIKICNALSAKEHLKKLDLNGNHFGDDGVDEIKDRAKEFRNPDALGSLSDDEGMESGSDDDEEESDRESSATEEENEKAEASPNKSTGDNDVPTVRLTVNNFWSSVSTTNITALSESVLAELMEEVTDNVTNAEASANAFVKLAALLNEDCLQSLDPCSQPAAEKLRSAVFMCTDVLLAEAFEKYPNTPMLVINPLLVRAGLIKSEDKQFKAPSDIRSLMVLLGHVCQQAYFPKFTRSLVRGVLAKDNPVWQKCLALRSQLMHTLFS